MAQQQPISWSSAPLSARDMLHLLYVHKLQTAGVTAEIYIAMLELISSRGNIPMPDLLTKPADDIIPLAKQCYDSINTMFASDEILKKAFGWQSQP